MTLKTALIGGAGILLALGAQAGGAQALDVLAVKAQIDQGLSSDYPHLDALYKDIHAHPELGFQEQATAAKLAKEMRGLGLEVTEGVGKTGVVAILRNGPGPMVLVRTELDALPLEEKTGLPYASAAHQMREGKDTFVDHACGHDIHMAVWVGVAKQLVALKKSWRDDGRRQGHAGRPSVPTLRKAGSGLRPACRAGGDGNR